MTLEATLRNISINPSSMDRPTEGEIFESNHLREIADIQNKLIQNLAKVGKTYHHVRTQLLNPSPEELENFLANHERDLDSCLHYILHLDELLARDAKHCVQLGYPVINYPRYIPTTIELCRASFSDIMDKLKADLAYCKDDFQNNDMFSHPQTYKWHTSPRHGTWSQHTQPIGCIYRRPWIYHTKRKPCAMSNSSALPKDHPDPTSQEHTCFDPEEHSCTLTLTSAIA